MAILMVVGRTAVAVGAVGVGVAIGGMCGARGGPLDEATPAILGHSVRLRPIPNQVKVTASVSSQSQVIRRRSAPREQLADGVEKHRLQLRERRGHVLGEGVEKKVSNLAEEVAAATGAKA